MGVESPARAGLASRIMGIGEVGSQRTLVRLGFFKMKAEGGRSEDEAKVEVKEEPWEEEGLDDGSLLRLEVLGSPTKGMYQSPSAKEHILQSRTSNQTPPRAADNVRDEAQTERMGHTSSMTPLMFLKPAINMKTKAAEEMITIDFDFDFLASNTQIERELSSIPAHVTPDRTSSAVKKSNMTPVPTTSNAAIPRQTLKIQDERPQHPAPQLYSTPALTRAAQDRMLMPPPTFKRPANPSLRSKSPSRPTMLKQTTILQNGRGRASVKSTTTHIKVASESEGFIVSSEPRRNIEFRKEGCDEFPANYDKEKENTAPVVLLREEDFDLSTQDCREIYG